MKVERINANVRLQNKPCSGEEAHRMIVDSLMAEIEEKQKVLHELLDEDIKQKFISQWTPNTKDINIYDMV